MLCLDAGNTRLKAAVWNGAAWERKAAVPYAEFASWAAGLPANISQVVACNVAGNTVAAQIEALATQRGWALHWLTASAEHAGVRNGYAEPARLGADRWAALLGARGMQLTDDARRRPLLVVLAGTATTIDALSADGWFRGGVILPGVRLMRDALARGTAQLPQAQGNAARWPVSTEAAIVSGSLEATAGAIERLFERLQHDAGVAPLCLLAGGAAGELAPTLAVAFELAPEIVLDGLRRHATALVLA